MHLALISCDQGLGHLRRSRLVANELVARGCRVTLLCSAEGWRRLERAGPPASATIELVDFATRTTPTGLRAGVPTAVSWDSRLPNLDSFDLVISDNLPEVLSRRPDAYLIAQFFWHDVLDDVDPAYRERALELLLENRPRIIGSSMFAMPGVIAQPGFQGVGLFAERVFSAGVEKAPGNDILFTGGSTPVARATLAAALATVGTAASGFETTWIDPQLWAEASFARSRPATFDHEMYARLGLAVCRPGLGVVTELITHRVPMIVVYEPGNREMSYNAQVLVAAGLAADPLRGDLPLRTLLEPAHWWRPPAQWPRLDGAASVAELILG